MTPMTKLLIVDDEPLILASMADLFEDEFEVHTSVDAVSALQYIEQNEVAVVLSDERMPGMPGHEFLEKVRQVSQATRLLLTGYADIKAIAQGVNAAQIYAYLTKPCDLDELRSAVQGALEHYKLIKAVEEERALLHALMESIPDPIYFKDAGSRFTKINRAKARLLGLNDPAACSGKLDSDFRPAAPLSHALEDELRVIQSGVVLADRIEEVRLDPDASAPSAWFSTTTAPVVDRRGWITGLVAISRNVTNLKITEQELRQKNEKLRAAQTELAANAAALECSEEALRLKNRVLKSILDSMGDAVIVGDQHGGVLLCNPAAQQLFGLLSPRNGPVTASPKTGFDPLRHLTPLANALRGKSTDAAELLLKDAPGGKPVWLSVTARPLREENGSVRGGVIVCREITQQKEAEGALRLATRTAEHANRAKSEFLSTMSHEIRTPMNAILAMADLLTDTPLDAQQKEYVSVFQRTGGNLLTLLDQVLDLSKVEAGHLELEAVEFDLEPLLRQRIDVMQAQARLRGVELTCEVKAGVPGKLLGDPNRIGQILFNLLANALKFTERGRASLVVERISGTSNKVSLRFSVIDTGIGIPAQKLALIFAPFTQVDASTTRQYGGTGLGLTISKALVELMGGRLQVESEVGIGSTFFFTAPFTVAPGLADEAEEVEPPADANLPFAEALISLGRRGVSILLADDSNDNIYVIRAYLRQPGVVLDVVKNGQEALDAFKQREYDVVLMDMEMPVMDGYTATRGIREWENTQGRSRTPVLALTAYALHGEVRKTTAAGCTAHLTKPIKRPVLIDAIYQHTLHVLRETEMDAPETAPINVDDEMKALKPVYLQSIEANIDAISEAVGREDYTIARKLGHQMAGSGGAYGFPEITKLGRALEKAAKEENGADVRIHLAELGKHVRTSVADSGIVNKFGRT
jgi:PAS domain S-box-containing protein